MGYEFMTAFFLEAGFLGILLFGRDRVAPAIYYFAVLMVAVGTLISAFWILSVNSWMQTPTGFAMNDAGPFIPKDWWQILFNPSLPYRLVHMVLAAYLTTALVVAGVGAWHHLKGSADDAGNAISPTPSGDAATIVIGSNPPSVLYLNLIGLPPRRCANV